MSLTTANLAASLQEHLSDNQALFAKYFVMPNNAGMQVIENITDKQPLYNLDVSDPGQPGDRSSYAPKSGVLDWKNRTLEVKNGEVTLKFTQNQIEALRRTHLAKIASEEREGNVYAVPFEEYMVQRVLAKLVDQVERTLKWKGALNATGTTTAAIANGFETKIAADISATDIPAANVFTGAAVTGSNALAQFQGILDIIASQAPEYLTQDLVCYAAPENIKFYWENYRATHGALPYNQDFQKRVLLDMPNIELIPQVGLSGDDRIVITPRDNFAIGTNALEAMGNISVETRERAVHFLVDFKIGFEYGLADLIWTNDL
jgi:hypothetical protein